MEAIDISESNVKDFSEILGEDLSEDVVKRIYYRGIGVTEDDGSAVGAMVCELLNADQDEEDRECMIHFLKSGDNEGFDALHSFYKDRTVEEEGIVASAYELYDESEAKALEEVRFSLQKKESKTIRLTLETLSKSKIAHAKQLPKHICSIEELSILQFRDAVKQILFKGHPGLLDDISYLPMTWFDCKVSACVISEDLVPGLFLIRRTLSGMLIPVLFCAYGAESQKNLLNMMKYSAKKAVELYQPEDTVVIMRMKQHIRALTDRLFPDIAGDEVFTGARKE